MAREDRAEPTASALPTAVSSTVALPAAAQDGQAAAVAATKWVQLWARPTTPTAQWLNDLAPLTFRDYIPKLATVDPSRVPASTVVGPAQLTSSAPAAARVTVPVNGSTVHSVAVQMIWFPTDSTGRWVVSAFSAG